MAGCFVLRNISTTFCWLGALDKQEQKEEAGGGTGSKEEGHDGLAKDDDVGASRPERHHQQQHRRNSIPRYEFALLLDAEIDLYNVFHDTSFDGPLSWPSMEGFLLSLNFSFRCSLF